jgi:uncharacterized membrane protein
MDVDAVEQPSRPSRRSLAGALAFARRRAPEIAILLLGAILRISMAKNFPPQSGYDFVDHWGYIDWMATHHSLPPVGLNYDSYHTPLYYAIGSLLERAGLAPPGIRALSIILAIARLALLWAALEMFLPGSRTARLVALALAALLPTSVHLDGMISNESLSGLLNLAAIIAMPRLLRAGGSWRDSVLVGGLCGLALLVKISGLVLLGALVLTFAALIYRRRPERLQLVARGTRSLAIVFGLVAAISGWFFVRSAVLYGKFMPTSYDAIAKPIQAPFENIPYLDRRTLGFFVGGSNEIFERPYYPSAAKNPSSRFWPVLTASTFVDYYGYYFAPEPAPGDQGVDAPRGRISTAAFQLSRASVMGGAIIAILTVFAFGACLLRCWREGDERLVFLLFTMLAVAGQLHFATQYPENSMGPIKGAYLQFAAGPLFAVFGLGIAWLWGRSRLGQLTALLAGGAMLAPASYVVYCRFVPFLR